jgi:hypothetical protein
MAHTIAGGAFVALMYGLSYGRYEAAITMWVAAPGRRDDVAHAALVHARSCRLLHAPHRRLQHTRAHQVFPGRWFRVTQLRMTSAVEPAHQSVLTMGPRPRSPPSHAGA